RLAATPRTFGPPRFVGFDLDIAVGTFVFWLREAATLGTPGVVGPLATLDAFAPADSQRDFPFFSFVDVLGCRAHIAPAATGFSDRKQGVNRRREFALFGLFGSAHPPTDPCRRTFAQRKRGDLLH